MDLTGFQSYWPLNETSTGAAPVPRADLRGGLTLSDPLNTPSTTGLVYPQAANFIRANTNVLFHNNDPALQMGNADFTFFTWVNFTSFPAVPFVSLISKGLNTDVSYLLHWDSGTNRIVFTIYGSAALGDSASARADILGAPSTGTWYFVECGYDATNDRAFIGINGGSRDISGIQTLGCFTETNEFDIGLTNGDGTTWLDAVQGPIMCWRRLLALTGEVDYLYNGGAGRTYAEIVGQPLWFPQGQTAGRAPTIILPSGMSN